MCEIWLLLYLLSKSRRQIHNFWCLLIFIVFVKIMKKKKRSNNQQIYSYFNYLTKQKQKTPLSSIQILQGRFFFSLINNFCYYWYFREFSLFLFLYPSREHDRYESNVIIIIIIIIIVHIAGWSNAWFNYPLEILKKKFIYKI